MKRSGILIAMLFIHSIIWAQISDVHISLEAQGISTTNGAVPFWLRSNQYGSIPLAGSSGSFIGKLRKDYDTSKTFDWGASFEGRTNLGNRSQFILVEGLIKAHAGIFEINAGRSKDIVGITDSTLSVGAFAVSGNALGIPKAGISIPNYYSIPIFGKLFAFKGAFYNGYFGSVDITIKDKPKDFKGYFIEQYLYGRIGMPQWRFKLQAGFNHEVMWGNERDIFGPGYKLSGLETYWYAVSGKVYDGSKVGNHLGSFDVGAEYRFDAFTVSAYRESLYDKGSLIHLDNIADGLNGLSLVNHSVKSGNFYWKKFLFEFLYTKNQAGLLSSKPSKSGEEDYYNNFEYQQGWSYLGEAIGIPFITPTHYSKQDLGSYYKKYFINNRVSALNFGSELYLYKWFYTVKLSYSQNFGSFANGTAPYRSLNGNIITPVATVPFKVVNQFSGYFEGTRPLHKGYSIGYDAGYDHGGLLYNSFGVVLKASKTFL